MSTKDPEKGDSMSSQETLNESSSSTTDSPPKNATSRGSGVGEVVYLERFAKTFEASARRWEMIVYPSLFGFIILAVYGFYLVYSLTRDMNTLADSMDPDMQPHMDILATNIVMLSESVDNMSGQITKMTQSVINMDKTMMAMNDTMTAMQKDVSDISRNMNTMEPILVNLSEMNVTIHKMNQSIVSMTMTMGKMSHDVGAATYQFARPMSVINSFFPW